MGLVIPTVSSRASQDLNMTYVARFRVHTICLHQRMLPLLKEGFYEQHS